MCFLLYAPVHVGYSADQSVPMVQAKWKMCCVDSVDESGVIEMPINWLPGLPKGGPLSLSPFLACSNTRVHLECLPL